ncbi:D-tyrosyl-tRNA(Tyr) deacylase [Candidatus Woesearchaeota archaeon]|nr:D-tyrosyl-tRNA(Tyr) deacylase [Candidatus Woesearchaeota archaeon]
MTTTIICSTQDIAGMNIRQCLLDLFPFQETQELFENHSVFQHNTTRLYTTQTDCIYLENLDEKIPADLFIFATRHASQSGIPSLSAHAPGNWHAADLGGKPQTLCIAPSLFIKKALKELEQYAGLGFDIIQEATHHGPYLGKTPCLFIEIGSNEEKWQDRKAGEAIAKTIMKLIEATPPAQVASAIGIGGPHHCPHFKKTMLETDIAIGHICPKYMLDHLTKEIILQALDRTKPKASLILLDWKGLGQYKESVRQMVEKLGTTWQKL